MRVPDSTAGRLGRPEHVKFTVSPLLHDGDMSECRLCLQDLDHCHDVSIEHADGSTECMDPACRLPHDLHEWQLSCSGLEPPCPCVPEEELPPLLLAA